ncbi:uncharacterized protein FA14DRAFT_95101 [Meira miltonrushii]|uniref:Uncharacterized protein n=1 Tax=Meira miltonrushii TaxID=1280837 RepID=A0A316V1F5_9BASI|nr:uncharacterized protein FA14DRAFT_95101 [Meira miltonrushii]PWN31379.1 hypothetical protein FA14DRAFT_95101 [Meira miltonrushii]
MKHALLFILLAVILTLTSTVCARTLAIPELSNRDVDDENLMATLTYRALNVFAGSDDEDQEMNLEKRARNKRLRNCSSDRDCPSSRYCSRNSGKCFKLRNRGANCKHDYVCGTGYCGRKTGRCARQKGNNSNCFGADTACKSGYCDSSTNKCSRRQKPGTPCTSARQCSSGYCRKNGTCSKHYHSPRPPPPVQTGK